MKKINLKTIKKSLSRNELRKIQGGSGCLGPWCLCGYPRTC